MNKIELKINHLVKDSNNVQELHGQIVSYIVQYLSSLGIDKKDLPKLINKLEKDMHKAAKILDFERAAEIRDKLKKLREMV